MAPDKSLVAEIEAVKAILLKHVKPWEIEGAPCVTGIPEAAAEIAALQSRAFEDGARRMQERAHAVAEASAPDCDGEIYIARKIADEIAALPLQPEGERNA